MLCNKMWKPTLFNIKKGWVKLLLFMARVPDAFFYGFTAIINHRFLTNQIARIISVIL